MDIIQRMTGQRLKLARHVHGLGWYTGRDSPTPTAWWQTTADLLYDSDYYGDDLPFLDEGAAHRWQPCAPAQRAPTRWTATTCALRCRRAISHA